MKLEKIRKTYDTPGRKWERESPGRTRKRNPHMRDCTFEEMLLEAVGRRVAIDTIDKVRK